MPRLAIVISAVGSIESLERTLVSVLENRPADCEILVALNGPYADPYDLKDEVRFIPPVGSASSTAATARALAASRAPFIHLLASGCQVSEGWTDAALARFGDRQVGSVAPLVWDSRQRERIFAAGVGYRRSGRRYCVGKGLAAIEPSLRTAILGPCHFAAFYRRAALDFVGGLNARLTPRQADADLALALKHAGFSVALEPRASVLASAQTDPSPRGFRQALGEERMFWRNLTGPGLTSAFLAHLGLVGWELAGSFPRPRMLTQLAGRMWACLEFGSHAPHSRKFDALAGRIA
ncbi:MAG: hypothetical protein WDZ48_03455, partial [Pirellulales bacterium]